MPQSFCTICRRRIPRGSRCAAHAIKSPSNRAWHVGGAFRARQKVLERDGGCILCGATERLEVHHLIPAAEGGPTTPDNLVVLCRRHHEAVERGEISLGPWARPTSRRALATLPEALTLIKHVT
jgi:hypothetical protein